VHRWDHLAFAIAAFLLALWPFTFMLPESPVYLVSKNKDDEAESALQWLRATSDVKQEIEALQDQRDLQRSKDSSHKPSVKDLFQPRFTKPLTIIIFIIVIRQFTGIFSVYSFVGDIFSRVGGSVTSYQSSLIAGAIQVISQFVNVAAVKRFGKKPLAIFSTVLMTAAQTGMGVYFYVDSRVGPVSGALTYLPIVSVCVAIVGFNVGMSSLPFIMIGELLPDEIRNYAAGVCFFANCMSSFLVVELFYRMMYWFNAFGTFWVYAGASFVALVAVIFVIPDTRGKSLADLQNEYVNTNKGSKKLETKNKKASAVFPELSIVVTKPGMVFSNHLYCSETPPRVET
jgi:facilitated trehalose transporter